MHKYFLSIFLVVSSFLMNGQSIVVSGYIMDIEEEAIPYVSVYQEGTSNATLSNDDGYYEIEIPEDSFIIFQYLGLKTQKILASSLADPTTFDVVMVEESFELGTVEVAADREDPAYAIIRKAIAAKKANDRNSNSYKAGLYVKGVMRIEDAPDKIFGQEIGTMSGILDSNKQGIIYLSETQSTIWKHFDQKKEVLHSSKLSGSDNGIGINQFIQNQINFYGEDINLTRKMIGPLDYDALSFYKYKLENTTVTEGKTINRIKVIPINEYRPCFTGELFIVEDNYQIHSLDLVASKEAIKSGAINYFSIKQVYSPLNNQWRLLTQNLEFEVDVFSFKAKGSFNSVFNDYRQLTDQEINTGFSKVIFEAEDSSIVNDINYWNQQRPIKLTKDEMADYQKKDSLKLLWESKPYQDSIDRESNKFIFQNLLYGYTYSQTYKHRSTSIGSPLMNTNFNVVEGWNSMIEVVHQNDNPDKNSSYSIKGQVKYGFSDKRFKPFASLRYNYNKRNLSSFLVSVGTRVRDISSSPIMAEISNSWHSLWFKNNFVQWYDQRIAYLGWRSEIANGLRLTLGSSAEVRNSLENTTNFSYRRKDRFYEDNLDIRTFGVGSLAESPEKYQLSAALSYKYGQKIMKYPKSKVRISSGAPRLTLKLDWALPLSEKAVDFAKIEFGITDNYLATGNIGYFSYNIQSGIFAFKNKVAFPDLFHFVGMEVIPRYISRYQSSFKLLPYYELASTDSFVAGYFQQHFDGWICDNVPVLKKLGVTFVGSLATLTRSDIQYFEPGIGIEGIRVGPIDAIRLDYYWGLSIDEGFRDRGFRFGFINFIGGGVDL